ncbi:hypothetical protein ACFY1P_34960 [Streptomyces sp. NPDC001407]|uniref:hypothetical protein n=1 Tax=Streptomyces sp. NPDC001407 TaxID=3364573 RepID=UPI0036C9EF05
MAAAATAVFSAAGVLHATFNTNIFGPERLCDGTLSAEDVHRILGTSGRISSSIQPQADTDSTTSFTCSVKVSTKFPDDRSRFLTLEVGDQPSGFPIDGSRGTASGSLSYFGDQALGGVSDSVGWLSLPNQCGKRMTAHDSGAPAQAVTIRLEEAPPAKEDRRIDISKALTTAMSKLGTSNGCAMVGENREPTLHDPSPERPINFAHACALPGFAIPDDARPGHVPQQETEQVSHKGQQVWSCDIRFKKTPEPQISIAMTQDKNLLASLSRDINRATPAAADWKANGSTSGPLMASCAKKDTYFSINVSSEYRQLIEKNKGISAAEAQREIFRSFLNAMGRQLGCSDIAP